MKKVIKWLWLFLLISMPIIGFAAEESSGSYCTKITGKEIADLIAGVATPKILPCNVVNEKMRYRLYAQFFTEGASYTFEHATILSAKPEVIVQDKQKANACAVTFQIEFTQEIDDGPIKRKINVNNMCLMRVN